MNNVSFIKTITAATGTLALFAAPLCADDAVPASSAECAVSAEFVYASATASATRGGVDMVGFDLRLQRNLDDNSAVDIGLLLVGGEQDADIYYNCDSVSSTNIALLGGYRAKFDFVPDKLTLFAGVRAGIAFVDYVIDAGHQGAWHTYASDSDLCLAYAGELGFSYKITEKWAVSGGYSYFGNTASVGGNALKISDQQYHLFKIGAEFRF